MPLPSLPRPRRRPLLVRTTLTVAAAATGAFAFAAPASAGTIDTANACRYNVDGGWRDHRMPLTGVVTAVAGDLSRDPSQAVAGETLSLRVTPSSPALIPDWIRREGFDRGFFRAGVNEFPVEMWFAIEGSNTVEGIQVRKVTANGRLVIRTNPDGSYRESDGGNPDESQDGFRLTDLPAIDTTWSAKGGRVEFRQASGGGLVRGGAEIPGVHGGSYTAEGSILARVVGVAGEDSTLLLDCEPGVTTEGEGELHDGRRRYQAKPFATVSVPGSVCIDRFGRERLDREIAGRGIELVREGDPQSAVAGQPLVLDGTRLEVELPREDVLEMYRQTGPSATLIAAAGRHSYPLTGRVAIRATGTREGTQAVAVNGSWTIDVDQPAGTSDRRDPGVTLRDLADPSREQTGPVRLTVTLPSTTWTPTGDGPVGFSLAGPGTAGPLAVVDPGVLPGGRDDAFTIHPYGAVLLRQGTDREGLDLDCLNGRIDVTGSTAYSTRGNLPAAQGGSAGRYSLAAREADPFYVAPLTVVDGPAPDGSGGGGPSTPPLLGGGGFAPPPVLRPTAAKPTAKRLRVASTALRRSGTTRVRVRVANPTAKTARGSVRLRTTARVRIGGKRRIVTVARTTYAIRAARTATVSLRLTADGRRLLATRRSLEVRVELAPRGGSSVTRIVRLSR